jgi:hypothetical protein
MFVFLLGLLQWLVLRQVGFAGSMTFSEFLRSSSIRAATLFGVLGIWGAAFTVIVLGVLGEWVAASTIGMTVGGVLLEVMGIDLGENMVGLVIGAVLGASIGIAQWVVLQRHVSRAGWWILASTLWSWGALRANYRGCYGLAIATASQKGNGSATSRRITTRSF